MRNRLMAMILSNARIYDSIRCALIINFTFASFFTYCTFQIMQDTKSGHDVEMLSNSYFMMPVIQGLIIININIMGSHCDYLNI